MNASLDGEWLLAVHERLRAASLEIVSVLLASNMRCKGFVTLPWEPMLREAFPNGPDRNDVDQLIESLQPFWRWHWCKDVLAMCSDSPRGYPLLPADLAVIGNASGDASVGEDAEPEGGKVDADSDAECDGEIDEEALLGGVEGMFL